MKKKYHPSKGMKSFEEYKPYRKEKRFNLESKIEHLFSNAKYGDPRNFAVAFIVVMVFSAVIIVGIGVNDYFSGRSVGMATAYPEAVNDGDIWFSSSEPLRVRAIIDDGVNNGYIFDKKVGEETKSYKIIESGSNIEVYSADGTKSYNLKYDGYWSNPKISTVGDFQKYYLDGYIDYDPQRNYNVYDSNLNTILGPTAERPDLSTPPVVKEGTYTKDDKTYEVTKVKGDIVYYTYTKDDGSTEERTMRRVYWDAFTGGATLQTPAPPVTPAPAANVPAASPGEVTISGVDVSKYTAVQKETMGLIASQIAAGKYDPKLTPDVAIGVSSIETGIGTAKTVVSTAGAVGIMQVMPSSAAGLIKSDGMAILGDKYTADMPAKMDAITSSVLRKYGYTSFDAMTKVSDRLRRTAESEVNDQLKAAGIDIADDTTNVKLGLAHLQRSFAAGKDVNGALHDYNPSQKYVNDVNVEIAKLKGISVSVTPSQPAAPTPDYAKVTQEQFNQGGEAENAVLAHLELTKNDKGQFVDSSGLIYDVKRDEKEGWKKDSPKTLNLEVEGKQVTFNKHEGFKTAANIQVYKSSSGLYYDQKGAIISLPIKKEEKLNHGSITTLIYVENGKVDANTVHKYVVVDDNGNPALISKSDYNTVKAMANAENLGFSITKNKGESIITQTTARGLKIKEIGYAYDKADDGESKAFNSKGEFVQGTAYTRTYNNYYFDSKGNQISVRRWEKLKEDERPAPIALYDQISTDYRPDPKTSKRTVVSGTSIRERPIFGEDGKPTGEKYTEASKVYALTDDKLRIKEGEGTRVFDYGNGNVVVFNCGFHGSCSIDEKASKASPEIIDKAKKEVSLQNRRNMFNEITRSLTQFRGLSGYSSLFFDDEFLTSWREGVDKVFASAYLGTEYWASALCSSKIDTEAEGMAYVETPDGLLGVAAHIEGEKTQNYNPLNNTQTYIYKISFFVQNHKNAISDFGFSKRDKKMKFNVEVRGPLGSKEIYDSDIELETGATYKVGHGNLIVKESPYLYNSVCIVFKTKINAIGDNFASSSKDELCNRISAYTGGPTTIATTSATGGGSGSGAPALAADW